MNPVTQQVLHESQQRIDKLEEASQAMHIGLLTMQARLDDHQKVIEQLMLVMQNMTAGQVPNGFRQPKKAN
jgi:seryl-tRNA synthetase